MRRAVHALVVTPIGLCLVHEGLAQVLVGQATMAQLLSPDPGAFFAATLVAATLMTRVLVIVVLPSAVVAWTVERGLDRARGSNDAAGRSSPGGPARRKGPS